MKKLLGYWKILLNRLKGLKEQFQCQKLKILV